MTIGKVKVRATIFIKKSTSKSKRKKRKRNSKISRRRLLALTLKKKNFDINFHAWQRSSGKGQSSKTIFKQGFSTMSNVPKEEKQSKRSMPKSKPTDFNVEWSNSKILPHWTRLTYFFHSSRIAIIDSIQFTAVQQLRRLVQCYTLIRRPF